MKRALRILIVLVLIALAAWALWRYGCPFCQAAQASPAKPSLPFSPAVQADGLIFVSGQIGASSESGELEEGIAGQTRRALENIKTVLEQNGAGMNNIVKTTVFLAEIDDFQSMNEEYVKFFPEVKPARSTVAVAGLVRGALIEIDAIAVKARGNGENR